MVDGSQQSECPHKILDHIAAYYDRTKDHWRTTAYRKVMSALKKETRKIFSKEEALEISFIKEQLANKIEEIVRTNGLRRLDDIDKDRNKKVL